MSDAMYAEKRQFGRRESAIHAVVMVGGKPPAHCIVCNYSERGALLEFKEPFVPSYRFRLLIETKGVDVLCEVRHQGRAGVGVLFVGGNVGGLIESKHQISSPAGSLPLRSSEPVKTTPRLTGADLRSSLFGRQPELAKEPVETCNAAAGGILKE